MVFRDKSFVKDSSETRSLCLLSMPPSSYKGSRVPEFEGLTRVEAGSNTSTVTLRVLGGDEKGSLKSERVKYGDESQGTQTRERLRWRGPTSYIKDRPIPSSERAPQKNKSVTVK
jgi:hypothetical protein